jgi:nucleoside 2-deoxyribosyltransferase
MMAIDKAKPELQDVRNAIKEVFKEFDIVAITADEIQLDDAITERILEEIETSEFLIADLTGGRPNVYYEVGHAHARGKRVILVRKEGEKVHFDIAHRNCPDYANNTALKDLLRKRLEFLTNKPTAKKG